MPFCLSNSFASSDEPEAEISLVVLLSALFEWVQHWVRHQMDTSGDKVGGLLDSRSCIGNGSAKLGAECLDASF